jgi:hypothetical protein
VHLFVVRGYNNKRFHIYGTDRLPPADIQISRGKNQYTVAFYLVNDGNSLTLKCRRMTIILCSLELVCRLSSASKSTEVCCTPDADLSMHILCECPSCYSGRPSRVDPYVCVAGRSLVSHHVSTNSLSANLCATVCHDSSVYMPLYLTKHFSGKKSLIVRRYY